MRMANVADQCHPGRRQGNQIGDFAGMIGPHLNDRRRSILIDAQQISGDPKMVVGVADGLQDPFRPAAGENGGTHFLGAGLAAAAGHRQHLHRGKLLQMLQSQLLKGAQ